MQIESLAKRVGDRIGKDPELVEVVHRSMFKFLLEHFRDRNNKAVNCIYLGKFMKNSNYDESGNSRKHLGGLEKPSI